MAKRILTTFTAVAICCTAFFNAGNVYANNVVLTVYAFSKKYDILDVETLRYNGKIYLKNANEFLNGIYLDTYEKPIDASIIFNSKSSKKFSINAGKTGRSINVSSAYNDVFTALNNNEKTVTLKTIEVPQSFTYSDAISSTYLRGKFTTYFPNSTIERKSNIALASSFIDGVTLYNNEEFSFNNIVGERSEERGFLQAKVISSGEFIDGVGGGVCQVSTTLYNGALISGLTITEYHQHSLLVNYVEPSFDAMVNYGVSDLKFKNQTGGIIFISAIVNDSSVTFEFYGKKLLVEYVREYKIIEKTPPPPQVLVESNDLYVGQSEIIQLEREGIKSEGYLSVYKNGEFAYRRKIRSNYYKALPQKTAIGVKRLPPSEENDVSVYDI